MPFEVRARKHVGTQNSLALKHIMNIGTRVSKLAREHVSTQGTLAHEHKSTHDTLAREHVRYAI